MRLLLPILAAVSLIGCAMASADEGATPPDSLTFSGSVVVREPVALPAGSLLTVTLEDVSRADAPSVTIAQTQFALDGRQAPIPFSLTYPSSAVQPTYTYAARARLTLDGRLLFTTTEHIRVDALNPSPAELPLTPVPTTDLPAIPDASLTDTYWKVIEVQGNPVQVTEQIREPHLVLASQDNRFHGSGGVNRLMGGYTLAGDSLAFSNAASTMMAGPPEAMQQEQAIIAALARVRGFRVAGDQLTLVDESGQPVLKAVAVALN
ncbi:MAG: META domain-containing protein [Mycobacterium sp.]